MKKIISRTFAVLIISLGLLASSGCVSILDATSKGPIQTDPGKRSFGDMLDDKRLNTIIAVNIKKADKKLDKSNITVTSYNSVVLLTGQVLNAQLRELAAKTARNVNKVRQVYNELEIMPNISFAQKAKDRWLDTKIDTKLFASKQAESHKVKIIVENSVVYLMGILDEEQTKLITDIVRNTTGVTKVVRAIEYIKSDNNADENEVSKIAVEAFDDAAVENSSANNSSSASGESYYDQITEEPNAVEGNPATKNINATPKRELQEESEILDSTPSNSQ